MTGGPAVELRDVSVHYGAAPALRAVSLVVHRGERVGLVGPSGAGKSTLLGLLNGTVAASSGEVCVLGERIAEMHGTALRRLRARIGTVHQQLHLVGPLRVVHNVNAGQLARWSTARALWSLVRPCGVDAARLALARVGLADRLFDRTDTLSGGQQQRVALARIVVQRPQLVLGDEPVSALDPVLAADVLALLRDIVESQPSALVMSLHDFTLARRFCTRLVGLREGEVVFNRIATDVTDTDAAELYARSVQPESA